MTSERQRREGAGREGGDGDGDGEVSQGESSLTATPRGPFTPLFLSCRHRAERRPMVQVMYFPKQGQPKS